MYVPWEDKKNPTVRIDEEASPQTAHKQIVQDTSPDNPPINIPTKNQQSTIWVSIPISTFFRLTNDQHKGRA